MAIDSSNGKMTTKKRLNMIDYAMDRMIIYYGSDLKEIYRGMKVHELARYIGQGERLEENEQFCLEIAAMLHNVGLKEMTEVTGDPEHIEKVRALYAEEEVKKILKPLDFGSVVEGRVAYLAGHSSDYKNAQRKDHRVLVEAIAIVDILDNQYDAFTVSEIYEKVFETEMGRALCRKLFGIADADSSEDEEEDPKKKSLGMQKRSDTADANSIRTNRIPTSCTKCGSTNLAPGVNGVYFCKKCGKENYDDFATIRKYIDDNGPASSTVISKALGIPKHFIKDFFREERLEITADSPYKARCEGCGAAITTGFLCEDCKRRQTVGATRGGKIKDTKWHSSIKY